MAFWNISYTPQRIIAEGVIAPNNYLFQNTGSNVIYVSDQQDVTADSRSLAIAPGTPFTWSRSDPMYAICGAGNPSSLFGVANGAEIGTSIEALLTPSAQYVVAALANTLYKSTYTLLNAIYTITCPAGVITTIDFYDVNGNLITQAVTAGGTITVNLATTAVQFDYWTNTGTNTQISITKSGTNIPFASGILSTFTASGTPGLVGDAYVVVVGGGGGGSGSWIGINAGQGGASGGITGGRVFLTGAEVLAIGTPGSAGTANIVSNATDGGSTTFAGFTATGGKAGNSPTSGATPAGGTPNGGVGGLQSATPVSSSANSNTIFSFFTEGTTGGGGGGTPGAGVKVGAGAGIGVGGSGGAIGIQPTAGTGYGSGGGGGGFQDGATAQNGANGAPGICYIII